MIQRGAMIHRKILIVLCMLICLSLSVSSDTARFTNDQDLYFTGDSSDPKTLYQDGIDGNSDIGVEICEVGSRYVGAFYAINTGSWQSTLISYSSSSDALSNAANNVGGCYQTQQGTFTISPSTLSTPNPNVYMAAFPGRSYIGYSTSSNPGSVSNFIYGEDDTRLLGSYDVSRRYEQGANQVTIYEPSITYLTSSGPFSKSASDGSYGISDEKRLVLGLCSDDHGESCADGGVLSSPSFPYYTDTGISPTMINDQNTHDRYVVINGLGYPICIGANINAVVNSVNPDPVYYSQTLSMSFQIQNRRDTGDEIDGGNVDITSEFDVRIRIYPEGDPGNITFEDVVTIDTNIMPDQTVDLNYNWSAYAHSGIYTVSISADIDDDITECNEGDNDDTMDFELKPIAIPTVEIDGLETDYFPRPNQPYNFSLHLENSDNEKMDSSVVQLVQTNGLNLMAPTQLFNRSTGPATVEESGLRTQSIVNFTTDYYGNTSFTMIPTYNRLYAEQYDYLDVEDIIGGHSIHLAGRDSEGDPLVFVVDDVVTRKYPLYIANYTEVTVQKTLDNQHMVGMVYDFMYRVYSNFLNTVVSEI